MNFLFDCEIPTTSDNFLAWTSNFLLKCRFFYSEFGGSFLWSIDKNLVTEEYRGQKLYTMRANKFRDVPTKSNPQEIIETTTAIHFTIVETSKGCILLSVYFPDVRPSSTDDFAEYFRCDISATWPEVARSLLDTRYIYPLNNILFEFRISVDPFTFLHWCSEELNATRKESYRRVTDRGEKRNYVYTQILLPDKIKPIWECAILSWESTKRIDEGIGDSSEGIMESGIIASIEMRIVSSADYQVICRYNSGYEHIKDWLWNLGVEISRVYGVAPSQIAGKMVERKVGRPHLPEDVWAWQQVNIEGRSKREVYKEWKELPEVKKRSLADETRHFNHITHHEWMSKRNK